jgi:hypothetical protein
MNTILTRMMIAMAALLGVMGLNAGLASAATQHAAAPASVVHITAPALLQSSQALGYCGPGISSKSQIVSYYAAHPGTAVEMYIRSNRSYYHLQADQSFGTYLNSPHVKVFRAPHGYRIKSNTYCPTSTSIAPYSGHYGVGGVLMLWYCKDVRGYNCVPIAKGYCNNIVTGKSVRPVPKHLPKPKKPKKPKKTAAPAPKAPTGSCNITISGSNITINGEVNNCSTFTTIVTCGNVSKTFSGADRDTVANDATTWQQANCVTAPPAVVPPPVIVVPPPVVIPPPVTPPPSVTILSCDTLNFVPAGQPSGLLSCVVNASAPGTFTIDGGIGSVAKSDGARTGSVSFPLSAGSNTLQFYAYAPNDADQPASFTLTFTAIVTTAGGTKQDQKTQVVPIHYSTRP